MSQILRPRDHIIWVFNMLLVLSAHRLMFDHISGMILMIRSQGRLRDEAHYPMARGSEIVVHYAVQASLYAQCCQWNLRPTHTHHTHTHTRRHPHPHRHGHRHGHTDTQIHRYTDTQIHRHTETHTHTERSSNFLI